VLALGIIGAPLLHMNVTLFRPNMIFQFDLPPILAVFPVLVGPLQTLLALLPAILLGLGSMVFAILKPGGFKKLVRFCWRQKYFLVVVVGTVALFKYEIQPRLSLGRSSNPAASIDASAANWSAALGGAHRLSRGPGDNDATAPGLVWENSHDATILSSPCVIGNLLIFSTATDIGPFTPEGRGAIVCVDAHTGTEVWRYSPPNYRATFSSPVVSGDSVVCGEGLHQVEDARVTCLNLQTGERRWEFRTRSHVESTAAIADGRVFIGAGSDGFYALSLEPDPKGQAKVLWHLDASDYADCESSPVVRDGVVYFGLGEGGTALCAVQAETGKLLWKLPTPYPVFAPPTIADGKLFLATGNGNYVQSASDLLAMKLQVLKDDEATEQQLADAAEKYKAVGEVWCVDLATHAVDWKFSTSDAVLGAIAFHSDGLFFGSRDRHVYKLSKDGQLVASYELPAPMISSPAVGTKHVYCTTANGRMFCLDDALKPVWDSGLGAGETFSSSPVIAHGHVYIGTARRGLQCVGSPGIPPVPVWNGGENGGSADDLPIPQDGAERWRFPSDDQAEFRVTAPMMPLLDSLFAVGVQDGKTKLIRLRIETADEIDRLIWSNEFAGTIDVALVGSGETICVVEESMHDSTLTLHSLSVLDGSIRWSHLITGDSQLHDRIASKPGVSRGTLRHGIAVDVDQVFFWQDKGSLCSVDLAQGTELWDQPNVDIRINPSLKHSSELGWGTPAIATGLLFALTAIEGDPASVMLSSIDAKSGVTLWRTRLNQPPLGSPIVDGLQVMLRRSSDVAIHSIVDGSFLRSVAIDDVPAMKPLLNPDETTYGKLVTPVVAAKGHAIFATERGKIVCFGGESP